MPIVNQVSNWVGIVGGLLGSIGAICTVVMCYWAAMDRRARRAVKAIDEETVPRDGNTTSAVPVGGEIRLRAVSREEEEEAPAKQAKPAKPAITSLGGGSRLKLGEFVFEEGPRVEE